MFRPPSLHSLDVAQSKQFTGSRSLTFNTPETETQVRSERRARLSVTFVQGRGIGRGTWKQTREKEHFIENFYASRSAISFKEEKV